MLQTYLHMYAAHRTDCLVRYENYAASRITRTCVPIKVTNLFVKERSYNRDFSKASSAVCYTVWFSFLEKAPERMEYSIPSFHLVIATLRVYVWINN